MMYSKSERGEASGERLADIDELGQSEELALAALAKKLRVVEAEADSELKLTQITDDEITSRDAQRLTLNSRHNIEFLKQRFSHRFCLDGSRRVAAFPRAEVEQYMQSYHDAEAMPDNYEGRRITSLASEAYPLATIFSVMRDVGIPIRLFSKPSSRQVTEYIDEAFVELVELGLAEIEPLAEVSNEEEDTWQPLGLEAQLGAISISRRGARRHRTAIAWDDDLIEITRIPPQAKPAAPVWLHKPADSDAISWQPRYIRSLGSVNGASIPLAELDSHLGVNATIALAAHQSDLAANSAVIGINEVGAPAVATDAVAVLAGLLASTEYSGIPIPDNWQTLEDVAKDANVKLDGEDGLETWVAEGLYGPEHVATVPYRETGIRRHLTFCSPQLARVIVDWVLRERQRLERAIELEDKYGRPGFEAPQPIVVEAIDSGDEDIADEDTDIDAMEELRAKLQSLETFAAQHSLEVQWIYELAHAKYDAYIVDYVADERKLVAHFATTEGIEYLLENLAPPEYRTSRQICEAYGIPLYLFDLYASDTEPAGSFLSNEWCANVQPMPHYAPEQANRILSNYYNDVADEPMRIAEIAAKTGQTILFVSDYLHRHGVSIDKNRSVLRQAGLRFLRDHQEIEVADEDTQTPTLFLMRTREARGCDLTHADVTTMCYELDIPLMTLRNVSAKKTTQHAPTDSLPDLQAAIERYYLRSK